MNEKHDNNLQDEEMQYYLNSLVWKTLKDMVIESEKMHRNIWFGKILFVLLVAVVVVCTCYMGMTGNILEG